MYRVFGCFSHSFEPCSNGWVVQSSLNQSFGTQTILSSMHPDFIYSSNLKLFQSILNSKYYQNYLLYSFFFSITFSLLVYICMLDKTTEIRAQLQFPCFTQPYSLLLLRALQKTLQEYFNILGFLSPCDGPLFLLQFHTDGWREFEYMYS